MNDELEAQRGVLAEQILTNPIYKEAFTVAKAELFDAWSKTKWYERKDRIELWRQLKSIERIEKSIARVMKSGNIARSNIAQKERLKQVK